MQKHKDFVNEALAKLLRKYASFLNVRDEAALKELVTNFDIYVLNDINILDRVNRIYR